MEYAVFQVQEGVLKLVQTYQTKEEAIKHAKSGLQMVVLEIFI